MAQSEGSLSGSLQLQLHNIAKAEGFTDYTFDYDTGSNKGDGFMSSMLAISVVGQRHHIDGKQRPDRLALICKVLPSNESQQQQFQSRMFFERETLMYNDILPAIEQFLEANGVNSTEKIIAYPKCYLAKPQTSTDDAIIILEDLRPSGFVMWDKKHPLQYAQAKLLVEQLGTLHGVSVALRQQQPQVYAKWSGIPDIMNAFLKGPVVQSILTSSFDRAIELLDNPKHKQILKAFKAEFRSINSKCTDGNALGAFSVLGHGDCWNNNMMYGPENMTITLLDWQLSRVMSPAVDLSYFFFSSTEKTLRDQHMDELIRLYYAKFSEIIRRCGSDPEKIYTFEDLQEQLRSFGVYGVLCAPNMVSIMVSESSDFVNMHELAETVDNIDDKKERHFSVLNSQSKHIYIQRLSDVIDDAIKYGWLSDYVKDQTD